MRNSFRSTLFSIAFFVGMFFGCTEKNPEPEDQVNLLIVGALVYDGSGADPAEVNVGITSDRITYVGTGLVEADSLIDLTGRKLALSPGFIDVHAHLEPIMRHPDATSHVMQGATLALGGPDGGGPWPFGEYLDSLDQLPLGMNVAYLVGHNRIRRTVMDFDNRAPTAEELILMKQHVAKAMEEGAFGLSTGLKYVPGAFSEVSEVIELSKVASVYGGIYTSHLREEGLGLLKGVREAIVIGKEARIPVVLTHHKAIGKPVWGASVTTLAMVDSAREAGIDVMMDQYPYTASYTGLAVLIPAWAMAGGQEQFVERTRNRDLRDSIKAGIEFNILNDRGGGDLRRIQFSRAPWKPELSGKTLHDWADLEGLEPDASNGAELVLKAQIEGGGTAIYHAMDEQDVERIMRHPMTMVASDGRLNPMGQGWPHPRWYGTFPRVLGYYTRDKGVLELKEALRKMTSLPAARLGLRDRGIIREQAYADIVIFDPLSVNDKATFSDPHHHPDGIVFVIVNGVITVSEGEMSQNRAGRVIRRPLEASDN